MAKKTRHRSNAARGSTSVSALRAARGIDALTPAFVRWFEGTQDLPAGAAMVVLEPVKALVTAYFEASPASEVTSFEPVPFALALDEVMGGVDEDDADLLEFTVESIHGYLEFLSETDAWTGSTEDFDAIQDLFSEDYEDYEDDDEDGWEGGIPDIVVPDLTVAEELAGLSGTVLAQRLDALLRWIGTGKDVTSRGWLRMKDIEGAGAAIGLAVRGARLSAHKAKDSQEALFDDPAAGSDAARTVKSMNDEPSMALFWNALQSALLIEIGATRAWLTPLAESYLEAAGEDKLAVLRDFTTSFIELAVKGEEVWNPWMLEAAAIETAVLVAATTDTPPAMERIRSLTAPAGGEGGESGPQFGDEMTGRILLHRLEYLAEFGLLAIGDHLSVPPAVVGCVAAALEGSLNVEDGSEVELERADIRIVPPSEARKRPRPAPKRNPKAPILQLKVMLKGSKPPVWRRLLVRSDLTLAELHHIIQASFAWQDCHMHNFQVGGWLGPEYGPADEEGLGGPPIEEAGVAIRELLANEGDSVTYTYDFGDNWEHSISVEKVLPADAGARAVRCTGGRGAAPLEDSGGVWGWAAMVAAANDPSHEEHEDFRDWLGLERGETLDPKAFDRDALDEELARLF
ncbi:plasmid pRiA4b ORF-3 family protein [Arthrobacter wenxiniae]|uniref:Plasmid pRiA4b ORF-3 family protein n=1 Tax=Arthrobacter wenxiniae TaxID=2713570 RepID=A0A7Y7IHF2_9MICC|nr:plasmid pRiA4b ORF-3 family protein [Arthrobacter wenxiniae]NVM95477.1 plasmid pRiA4b ORF-3 family protein [Arthrobacter wenxiniae]